MRESTELPIQPSPTPSARAPGATIIDSCGRTDRGTRRADNQDHFLVAEMWRVLKIEQCTIPRAFERPGETARVGFLYAVADGMGGHAAGERASRAALEAIEMHVLSELAAAGDVGLALQGVFRRCEERVQKLQTSEESARPPGTTLTAALVMDGRAYITHVGDSRAYLIRAGRPMQITKDHTLGEWLDREGFGNRSENRFQNVLVNAIGGGTERAIIDMTGFDLLPDDALVLCSDGLTRSVADKEIAEIVSDSASASEACDRLLAVALERDGGDNVTVVIACSAD